jgi:hypothetical protein
MVNAGNAGNAGRLRVIEATAPSFGVRLSSSAIHDASEVETGLCELQNCGIEKTRSRRAAQHGTSLSWKTS